MSYAETKVKCGGSLLRFCFPTGIYLNLRFLTYREFKTFYSLYKSPSLPTSYIDELVALTVIQDDFVTKSWLEDKPAGICSTVANLMMFLSGDHRGEDIGTLNAMADASRSECNVLDNTVYSAICRVYPGYKFSDLDDLPFPEVLRIFACAERILIESNVWAEPIKFTTPEALTPEQPAEPGSLVITDKEIRETEREAGDTGRNPAAIHDLEVERLAAAKRFRAMQDAEQKGKSYNNSNGPKPTRSIRKRK